MVEVGFGQGDITPPVGAPLSGFIARHNLPSTGVDAPLLVRSLAIRDQEQVYLLMSYDLVGIPASIETTLLSRIASTLGRQCVEANCVITATHNHSGPVLGLLCGEPPADPAYVEVLAARSAQAAVSAIENLQPAELFVTQRRLPGLTYNRRAVLADGRVSISPQPDGIVFERGSLDDRITLLLWRSPRGKALVGLVHFACHGVAVLSQAIGPDIPGELAGRIGETLGAPCLFLQGAAGDVNPTTVTASRSELLDWIERAVRCLGSLNTAFQPAHLASIQTTASWLPFDYAGLPDETTASQTLRYLHRVAGGDFTSPDLADILLAFRNTLNLPPSEPLEAGMAMHMAQVLSGSAQKTLEALRSGRPLPPQYMHIKLWLLGEYVLTFLSGEIFSATGVRLHELSQKRTVLPVSCLAPLLGYLPDRKASGQGGYEVEDAWRFYGHPAPFASDSEERLVAEVHRLLTQMGD